MTRQNKGGRPTKIPEQVSGDKLLSAEFETEEALEAYLDRNIDSVVRALTGHGCKTHERQFNLNRISPGRAYSYGRVDLRFEDETGAEYFIEVKNPRSNQDNLHGITQLLFYKSIYQDIWGKDARLVLITSKCDVVVAKMIDQFHIPVTLAVAKPGKLYILNHYGSPSYMDN